jgi:hypothetical protein
MGSIVDNKRSLVVPEMSSLCMVGFYFLLPGLRAIRMLKKCDVNQSSSVGNE